MNAKIMGSNGKKIRLLFLPLKMKIIISEKRKPVRSFSDLTPKNYPEKTTLIKIVR